MRFRHIVAALVAAVTLGIPGAGEEIKTTDPLTVQVREVGSQIKCQCGSCSYTVADCNMLYCHFRVPVNEEIAKDLEAGMTVPQILSKLLTKYGGAIRTAPEAAGFGAVGWAMPFAALALGLIIAPFVVRRLRRTQPAVDGDLAAIDPATLKRLEDEIEKDLARLE